MELIFVNIHLTFNPNYFYLLVILSFLFIFFKKVKLAVTANLVFIFYLFISNYRIIMGAYQCGIKASEYWCFVPYGIAILLVGIFLFYFVELFESTL